MKKLLIIAYFYPPYGEVGAVRIAKISKYLKRFGWDINVISVKEQYYKTINNSYVQDIENINVTRTYTLPKFIKGINEEGFYWTPILFIVLIYKLLKYKPNIVFITGGPFYHWILSPIIKVFGIDYVLDFRDPWQLNPYSKRKNNLFSRISRYLEKLIEPFAIKYANKVINVTEQATNMYKEHYAKYQDKFITIPNGYDPEDFENIIPKKVSNFDIVYSGKFGGFRDPKPFLEAFKAYIQEKNLSKEDIRFVWIGNVEKSVMDIIKELNIEEYVYTTGFIDYKENLSYIKGADLCLLITGNHPYEPTTKVFDYLAFNKPILPIINVKGFLSDLFDEIGIEYLENKTFLILNGLKKSRIVTCSQKDILSYNRKILINKLSKLL